MPDRTFLAWPFFDASHRVLAERIEDWAAREVAPFERQESDVDALAVDFVRRLGRDGWLRYCVPSAYGGAHERIDVRSICLVRETLARRSGLADVTFAMQGLGSASIALAGTEALRRRYLPEVADGRRVAAFAL